MRHNRYLKINNISFFYLLFIIMSKTSKHRLLHISSADRVAGSNSNFAVSLTNGDGLSHIRHITLKSANFVHVFYNMNQYNNTFTFEKGVGEIVSVVLPIGQYSILTLTSALQGLMSSEGLTITQNQITKRLTFATSNYPIKYFASPYSPMSEFLGITQDSAGLVSSFNGQSTSHLEGLQHLFIESPELGQTNLISTNNGVRNVAGIIPINDEFGAIIHYEESSELDEINAHSRHGRNLSSISIRITDERGQTLDLQNNAINLIFKVYY